MDEDRRYLREIVDLLLERQDLSANAHLNRRMARLEFHAAITCRMSYMENLEEARLHTEAAEESSNLAACHRTRATYFTYQAHDSRETADIIAESDGPDAEQHWGTAASHMADYYMSMTQARSSEGWAKKHSRDAARSRLEAEEHSEMARKDQETAMEHFRLSTEYRDYEARAVYISQRVSAIVNRLHEAGYPVIPEVPDFNAMVSESRTEQDDILDARVDAAEAELGLEINTLLPLSLLTPSERTMLLSDICTGLTTQYAISDANKAASVTKEALWGPNPSDRTRRLWCMYPDMDDETLYLCELRRRFDVEVEGKG